MHLQALTMPCVGAELQCLEIGTGSLRKKRDLSLALRRLPDQTLHLEWRIALVLNHSHSIVAGGLPEMS